MILRRKIVSLLLVTALCMGMVVNEHASEISETEKKAEEFCEQLDKMFGSMPKAVIRAVMAKVLSGLPMIFRDSQEVEDYIRSSLESCTDHGEREACMELLEQELMG